MKNIQSIKVLVNKYSTNVYVDFDNGTFGIRSFEAGKWTTSGLTTDELNAAKKIAVVNGKWTNWTAPRKSASYAPRTNQTDEGDTRDDLEALRSFNAKQNDTPYQSEEELGKLGL